MTASDPSASEPRWNFLRHVGERVAAARYTLAAAVAALLFLWAAGLTPVTLLVAFVIVALASLFSPPPSRARSSSSSVPDTEPAISGVSGERLASQLPDPLIFFNADSSVLYANRAARTAFGVLSQGSLLYMRFRTREMHALIQGVIASGMPNSIDYFERVPVERWYRAMVLALDAGPNKGSLFLLTFRDQSEARRIDRMRQDFVANASHELRTPLASLSGFIETLRGPARKDEVARERFLEIMQTQADRMARLIDDLLSLSRIEMKAHIAVTDVVDLSAILSHVADALTPLAGDLGVEIERRLPDHPVNIPGDRDELMQVFENLVENACKYGQSGKRVIVDLTTGDDEVIATVRDFGPGISEEHIPRLTERFYRIDVETSRSQKGTGLGLAIVKHILTRHKARLTVRSRVGEGSSFTVQFPSHL